MKKQKTLADYLMHGGIAGRKFRHIVDAKTGVYIDYKLPPKRVKIEEYNPLCSGHEPYVYFYPVGHREFNLADHLGDLEIKLKRSERR